MAISKNSEKDRDNLKKVEYEIKALLLLALFFSYSREKFVIETKNKLKKINDINLIDKKSIIQAMYLSYLDLFSKLQNEVKRKNLEIKDKNKILNKQQEKIIQEVLDNTPKIEEDNPFSIYTKIDLDRNQEEQMEMLKEVLESGEDLWWLSAHYDASERCKRRQGKLVSMSLKSIDNSFWTGKVVEGHKVYSFIDIETLDDEYGKGNTIINGYHCRHFLYKWTSGSKPMPTKTRRSEDALYLKNREKLKRERYIRERKRDSKIWNGYKIKNKKALRERINVATRRYFKFCEDNGLMPNLDALNI